LTNWWFFVVFLNPKATNQLLKDLFIPQYTILIAITRDESLLILKGDTQILVDDDILALTSEVSRKELEKVLD